MSDEIKIEYRPLAELARWKRNPKGHDIPALKSSIRRWGFINPLIEDGTAQRIVAGHGRLEALLSMQQAGEEPPARIKVNGKGEWLAPIVTGVSFETELDAEAFLLADNRLVELGGWEQAGLTSMLEDLQLAGVADGTGWTDQEIANMLATAPSEPERALNPQEREAAYEVAYEAGLIKQIVLYFPGSEFDSILNRLQAAQERSKTDNHTETFLYLLEQDERNHPSGPPKG